MIPRFPGRVLRDTALTWQIGGRSISAGQTGSGVEPTAETSGGGLWRAELASVRIRTPDEVRCWRVLEGLLDSGAAQVIVTMCDKRYFPVPEVNGAPLLSYGDLPVTDDGTNTALFDDDTGIAQPVVVAYVAEDAALRATEIAISFVQSGELMGGEHFSIDHPNLGPRIYRIVKVVEEEGASRVTIRPPLREAVQALTDVEFDAPACVMKVASAESMRLTLDQRRRGSPTASFIESFDALAETFERVATLPGAAASGIAGPWTSGRFNFANPDNSQYLPGL
ncbi:hypothetical protein ACQR1Y_12245 [Bradyrhizobium sp. HKCCYLRH3099]|uniref:hypothetical protein n=1 Tax=unclassified Bradyrhizobium TaxID=2631580 RepID=UPI003EBB95C2